SGGQHRVRAGSSPVSPVATRLAAALARASGALANASGRHHGTMRVAIEKGATAPFFIAGAPHPAQQSGPVTASGKPMLNRLLTSVFGSRNDRSVKQL